MREWISITRWWKVFLIPFECEATEYDISFSESVCQIKSYPFLIGYTVMWISMVFLLQLSKNSSGIFGSSRPLVTSCICVSGKKRLLIVRISGSRGWSKGSPPINLRSFILSSNNSPSLAKSLVSCTGSMNSFLAIGEKCEQLLQFRLQCSTRETSR